MSESKKDADNSTASVELAKADGGAWKQALGAFLTKRGAAIGAALVVVGGVLEGGTGWVDALTHILKSFFGG